MDMLGLSAAQLDSAGARWTATEILQQPQVWTEVAALLGEHGPALGRFLDPLLARANLRIVLTGAGTSAYIGGCIAPAATRGLRRPVEAIATTDLVSDPATHLFANTPTLLVSFSRSGNSPESVAAVNIAEQFVQECFHLIVTCDAAGALFKWAHGKANAHVIVLPDKSNDRSFAMTSSFTGMTLAAAIALRAVRGDRASQLGAVATRVIPERLSLVQSLVERKFQRVVYLGSKELQALARESALKLLEMTDGAIVALSESSLGFRHGPKTILNRDTLVVMYVSTDPYTRQYDLDLLDELRRENVAGRVIAFAGGMLRAPHADDIVLPANGFSDLELCLPFAMFAQSLAMLTALSLGKRPDNPNAAGTVSRVVKGVTIHPWRDSV